MEEILEILTQTHAADRLALMRHQATRIGPQFGLFQHGAIQFRNRRIELIEKAQGGWTRLGAILNFRVCRIRELAEHGGLTYDIN